MSERDEERFQSSNRCWICDKLSDVRDNKVRDHRHATGKYRGSPYWSCNNNNLKLTKEVCVKLKGYHSHLIM